MTITEATMLAGLLAASAQAGSPPAWTWTLYEGDGPVVFANEVPDTPQLRSTLECAAGSGVVTLSLYQSNLGAGFATVASGDASATVEATRRPDGALAAPLRTDHPVFGRFAAGGVLTVAVGGAPYPVEVPAASLAGLRRFSDLCGA